MKPTNEQIDSVTKFRSGSLRVNAYAGAAKTTTATLIAEDQDRLGQRGLYLAFNKSIAAEAATRFPRSVSCKTTHGLAFAPMLKALGGSTEKLTGSINANAVAQAIELPAIALRVNQSSKILTSRECASLVLDTVKRFCHSDSDHIMVKHLPHDGVMDALEVSEREAIAEDVLPAAAALWRRMQASEDPLPCGFDGYLKLWALGRPRIYADYIMLDEAQDSNPVVLKIIADSGLKALYVGDKYQQIYSWRGAVNAMDRIKTDHTAYLTQSFRFGDSIANFAALPLMLLGAEQRLIGTPTIPSELHLIEDDKGKGGERKKDQVAILARTNMELIAEYVYLLGKGQRPHIIGGTADIERALRDVIALQAGKPSSSPEFFGFSHWSEVVEFVESPSGASSNLKPLVRLTKAHKPEQLIDEVRRASPDEATAQYRLSTAHKSKGREWDRVRLAGDFKVEDDEEALAADEELRLFYVASTRAKRHLGVPAQYVTALLKHAEAKIGIPASAL